jgi:hypothetical protein
MMYPKLGELGDPVMADDKLAIFVSCGTPHNKAQKGFIECIDAFLASRECIPQTLGRNVYSVRQPVEAARELITQCDGAVVIAFERTRILHALDRPGADDQKEIRGESHATVWNQMEAAMAYANKVPLLLLIEKGLKRQGMLSDRLEWMAIETDLSPTLVSTEAFQQVFKEWMTLVRARRKYPQLLTNAEGKWKVRDLITIFGNLDAKDAWSLIGAVFVILAAVATSAYTIGNWTRETGSAKKSAIELPAQQATFYSRVGLS